MNISVCKNKPKPTIPGLYKWGNMLVWALDTNHGIILSGSVIPGYAKGDYCTKFEPFTDTNIWTFVPGDVELVVTVNE